MTDYKKAYDDANRIIELGAANASVYYIRGKANEKLGKLQAALLDYQRSFELDPSYM